METGRGTALITACSQGDCDMAALLIDKGAKPNFESRSGATPLISAVREDHSEVVKVLLQRGADPELTTADGASAVQIAQLKALPMTLALLMQAIVVRDVRCSPPIPLIPFTTSTCLLHPPAFLLSAT
mmetsp:Transcript_5045/g.12680  ORF Transcript_5045/g.12680 Transcript_5045/m.12680 type:complete len:128 (+) Transcript_5045:487-870(+)